MIVQDIITNKTVYRLLIKPFIKNGILKTPYGYIDLSNQHQFIQSLIYWNVYERKEIAAIKKYLDQNLDIIELGSSIGLVSLAVGKMLNGRDNKFISVEANPLLINNLKNSAALNHYAIHFINAAVCYTADKVHFDIDVRNLRSKIAEADDGKTVIVNGTTLSKLFHENKIGKYALICDIEGAESHIFSYETDQQAIDDCLQIIIELHDTRIGDIDYSKAKLAEMIIKKFSMRLVFSADDIWVFEK
jgi:FkbM family methyltransferase